MTSDIDTLLSLAREVGAETEFSPAIEFPNALALQEFAERIRQDERERAITAQSDGAHGKPSSEQMMAGYEVACRFGVYEARAFDLAEQMYRAMSTAQPTESTEDARKAHFLKLEQIDNEFGRELKRMELEWLQWKHERASSGTSQSNPLRGGGNG